MIKVRKKRVESKIIISQCAKIVMMLDIEQNAVPYTCRDVAGGFCIAILLIFVLPFVMLPQFHTSFRTPILLFRIESWEANSLL
jgi:hypothetical protein